MGRFLGWLLGGWVRCLGGLVVWVVLGGSGGWVVRVVMGRMVGWVWYGSVLGG